MKLMNYYAFLEDSKFELKENCIECYLNDLIPDSEIATVIRRFMTGHENAIIEHITKRRIDSFVEEFFEDLKKQGLPIDDIIQGFQRNWKLEGDFCKVCRKKDFYKYLDCLHDAADVILPEITVAEIQVPEKLTRHKDGLCHLRQGFTYIIRNIDLTYVLELALKDLPIIDNESADSPMKILMRYAIYYKKLDIINYLIDECEFDIDSEFERSYKSRRLDRKFPDGSLHNCVSWAMITNDIDTAMYLFRKGCTRYTKAIMTSIDLGRFDIVETMIADFDLITSLNQKDQEEIMSRIVDTNVEILQKYLRAGFPLNDEILEDNTIEAISVAYYLIENDLGLSIKSICAAIADLAYKERGALWQYMENANYFQGDALITDLRVYALEKDDRYLADYLFSKGINVNDEESMINIISSMDKHYLMFFQVMVDNGVDLNRDLLRRKALRSLEYCKTFGYSDEEPCDRDLWLKTFNYLVEHAGILQINELLFRIATWDNWALVMVLETYPDLNVKIRISRKVFRDNYLADGVALANEPEREISLIEVIALRDHSCLDTEHLEELLDILLRRGCYIADEEITQILNYHFNQLIFTDEKLYRLLIRVIEYFTKQRAFRFEHESMDFWKKHFDS